MTPPVSTLMTLRDISCSHAGSPLLRDVRMEIRKGEIHALIGEHGAGKSSLAHILGGFIRTEGRLFWEGRELSSFNSRRARELGISYVTQGTELFDYQSVALNLFSNHPGIFRGLFYFSSRLQKMAAGYLKGIGSSIDPRRMAGELSRPERTLIEVLRHVLRAPRLLILDEVFERLTAEDLKRVIKIIRRLRDEGCAVLFLTHRIDDVYKFADRASILREGRILVSEEVDKIDKIYLFRLTHTQLTNSKFKADGDSDFYDLLKYNEAILELLPITLLMVDREQRIRLINRHGEHFLHRVKKDLLGGSLEDAFGRENGPVLDQISALLKQRSWDRLFESRLILAGREICANMLVYPILDGSYYLGSIIIVDDATEQVELRRKIQLSDKLASVGLLAAGVAHEINNPLSIIANYLDVLKGQQASEEAEGYIGSMEEEINSIAQIVGNLITFSEKKRYDYEDEPLDLTALLKRTVRLVEIGARKRGIVLRSAIPDDKLIIKANSTRIKQVFLNLIRNAFDAMKEGGELLVELTVLSGPAEGPHPQDPNHQDPNPGEPKTVQIDFSDTGKGLSPEERERVMLPFYTTKAESADNMGLGLSIVYGILESYGGSFDIAGREDRSGCRVRVTLPLL